VAFEKSFSAHAPRLLSATASTYLPRPRDWYDRYQLVLVATDAVVITFSLVAANLWWMGARLQVSVGSRYISRPVACVFIGVLWWLVLTGDSRSRGVIGNGSEEYRRVIRASIFMFGGLAIWAYFLDAAIAREFFLILLPMGTVLVLIGRWAGRLILHHARVDGLAFTPTVIVGGASEVRDAVRDLRRNPDAGYRPVAVSLSPSEDNARIMASPEMANLRVIDLECVRRQVTGHQLRAVVVTPGLPRPVIRQLAWDLENSLVRLMFVPSLVDVAGPRVSVHQMQDLSLLNIDLPRYSGWTVALKRLFDLVFSAVALIFLSPILAVVAVLIKAEDGGPILFRQERIGVGGEPFVIHKFRTMCVDAESRIDAMIAAGGGTALLFKVEDDPRITRIGKVLRKYSLDELPQFWTVGLGCMSVVGPRPQVSREVAEYSGDAHRRLLIKPGITGLWQVNGRSKLSIEDSIRFDLRYVENWSVTGDLNIIARTILVVLRPDGAY
jgi:exopolysaccharide biosynthesis polyprenyl glycosylphosphotransferase